MSELQSEDIQDEVISEEIEQEEVEQEIEEEIETDDENEDDADHESESDLATDSEEEHEENTSDVNQDAINKKFAKLTFERRQKERENQELLDRLAQYEKPPEPTVMPQAPDPFSDNYEQEQQKYQQDLITYGQQKAKQESYQFEQQQKAQQNQIKQAQELQEKAKSYSQRAKDLGVKPEVLQQSGQLIEAYGLSNDLVNTILEDEHGPLITTHLARNPDQLETITRMNPVQAGIYLTNIKAKFSGIKQKQTKAPKPPTKVKPTQSVNTGGFKYIDGATFE